MTYDITNTNVIYLGRQGENLARTVEIDVNSILGKWPNATISLLVQRNQEDTFYLPDVVIENGILKWTISNADTEFAGDGKAEIRATQDDVIVKSAMMNTHVSDSLGGTETDIPDPAQTWADTIIAASEQAKQSAKDALASELAAKEAAESITELESNIKTAEAARVEAEKGRAMAESDRVAAEEMREDAEDARVEAEKGRAMAESDRVAAEEMRETAEEARVEAENERISAENERESAESSRGTAESERVAAESERMTAENKRVTAETARSNAETSRASAEQERQTAEGTRVSAETSRETAENNRVAAETARVTAEQSRASAETARESAETDRQTTFETNESQRQTEFETAEAGRAAAESSRVAAEESRVSAEAGRVEAESERVTAENQRAETFAGYETRIDAATPDDSTVDGKTWTSRKIVDTLCPPFDVSGSAVTCHPVEHYPLDVKVSLEPVQEGSGDPSPDNIRPIVGWDSVKVNRAGKNLLDFTSFTNYMNWRLDIATEGNAPTNDTNKGYILPVKPSKTYTISFEFLGDTFPSYLYLVKSIHGVSERYKYITADKIINKVVSFTPADNEIWYLRMGSTGIENTFNAQIENITYIQLEIGSTATAYEPYISDTYTAELPETIYGGELDWNNGILIVDWAKFSINTSGIRKDSDKRYFHTTLNYNNVKPAKGGQKNAISNVMVSFNNIGNNVTGNSFSLYSSGIIRFYIDGITTLEEMVAYATENPIEIAYKLATPYTIQITPQQITALSGVNTLYTDSGDISVSGRTDMIWLTQSLIDRIAALETAAVSE